MLDFLKQVEMNYWQNGYIIICALILQKLK